MPGHDVFVVGFSAGGLAALIRLVSGLPVNLPAAVFVVHHFPPSSTSLLPRILSRAGPLHAEHAVDGEPIQCGRMYAAPTDRHRLINNGTKSAARFDESEHEAGHGADVIRQLVLSGVDDVPVMEDV